MVNVLALRKELMFITENQDKWNQKVWTQFDECGTVACLAGWAALHNGWTIQPGELVSKDDMLLSVHEAACKELDLNPAQADSLFSVFNNLVDMWIIADMITNRKIDPPEKIRSMPKFNNSLTRHRIITDLVSQH